MIIRVNFVKEAKRPISQCVRVQHVARTVARKCIAACTVLRGPSRSVVEVAAAAAEEHVHHVSCARFDQIRTIARANTPTEPIRLLDRAAACVAREQTIGRGARTLVGGLHDALHAVDVSVHQPASAVSSRRASARGLQLSWYLRKSVGSSRKS